jgi:hypothetical protein
MAFAESTHPGATRPATTLAVRTTVRTGPANKKTSVSTAW